MSSWHTKAAGVTFENRQETIDKMTGDEPLRLVHEADNKFDPNAIAVQVLLDGDWKDVGYIPKVHNLDIARAIKDGLEVTIDEYNITGGDEGRSYGINLGILMPAQTRLDKLQKLVPSIGEGFVYFDPESHLYYNEAGEQMKSGSQLEKEEVGELDLSYAAAAMAKSTGIDKATIIKLWETNGDLSRDFGTLVHSGLEFYLRNAETLFTIDEMKQRRHLPSNWMSNSLGHIVKKYIERFHPQNVECEVFVRWGNYCGFVDQLMHLSDGSVRIIDYKVANEISKVKTKSYGQVMKYSVQQNFYKAILEKNGIKVARTELHQWTGSMWKRIPLEDTKIDLE